MAKFVLSLWFLVCVSVCLPSFQRSDQGSFHSLAKGLFVVRQSEAEYHSTQKNIGTQMHKLICTLMDW